jgi:hypothetical protein
MSAPAAGAATGSGAPEDVRRNHCSAGAACAGRSGFASRVEIAWVAVAPGDRADSASGASPVDPALTITIDSVACTFFYYDQRIRPEGFDIERMMLQAKEPLK